MPFSTDTLDKPLALNQATPVHFVGIGGVGMSGLAKILAESGFQVSGSDVATNAYTQQVADAGATIYQGHRAEQVPESAQLIVSSSIDRANPEIAAALARGQEIHHRSALLREVLQGEQMGHTTTIGITGTHGKTTITGMTGLALHLAGCDPTVVVGGKMPHLKTNAIYGQSRSVAVAELDESDGTILQYQPTLSVVANLELDHADHYTDGLQGVLNTFRKYLSALKPGSKVLYNVTCPNTRALLEENPSHVEAILLDPENTLLSNETRTVYRLDNVTSAGRGCYQAVVYRNQTRLGELQLSVPGKHNLFNGLCAAAVGDQLGVPFERLAEALRQFTGMGRRFEKVGEALGALLIDDYAHHPSEVAATLKAAREAVEGKGRIIAVFQPHRYSRLQALWNEFRTCFTDADVVFLTDVYAAHEPVIPGMTSDAFAKEVAHPDVRYVPQDSEFKTLRAALAQEIRPGDLALSMGAGNITQLLRDWRPA